MRRKGQLLRLPSALALAALAHLGAPAGAQQLALEPRAIPMTAEGFVRAARASADLRVAAVLTETYTIEIWDVAGERKVQQIPGVWPRGQGLASTVSGLALSADGRQVAFGGADGFVRVWDVASGRLEHQLPHTPDGTRRRIPSGREHNWPSGAPVAAVRFDPTGRFVASVSGGTVALWDLGGGSQVWLRWHLREDARPATLGDVAFSPAGDALATVGDGGGLRFWSAQTGMHLGHFPAEARWAAVEFSADGSAILLTGARGLGQSTTGTLQVWSLHTGAMVRELAFPGFARFAALSPDARHVASGNSAFLVWDVVTGQKVLELPRAFRYEAVGPGPLYGTNAARFSLDGTRLLSLHDAKRPLVLWRAAGTEP